MLKTFKTFVHHQADFITARKRSLRRLCFYRCLSVHNGGACVVPAEVCGCSRGVRGCSGGACVVFLGGACVVFAEGGMHGFFQGDVHGFFQGGLHGFFLGGMHRIRWDTVNERVVRILLECILVHFIFSQNFSWVCLPLCLSVYVSVHLSVCLAGCLCVCSDDNFWTAEGRNLIFSTHIHLYNI